MVGQLSQHLHKVKAVIPNNCCVEQEQKKESEEMFQTFAKKIAWVAVCIVPGQGRIWCLSKKPILGASLHVFAVLWRNMFFNTSTLEYSMVAGVIILQQTILSAIMVSDTKLIY